MLFRSRTIAAASTVEPSVKGTLQSGERGGNVAGAKAIGPSRPGQHQAEQQHQRQGDNAAHSGPGNGPKG